ncbi:hypothetical protein CENSYa_0795 [Cenarchaeum symbiosum A]|uniref:Uncharacterized protein n=1 Tax=Cenarchaeum symbiosum (strain A) TaxID=414004 RepID=A0RVR1_CENSY|nr:hypothetical protein CENSYa_0795 [Cenarchaeum symbiosum A]
MPKPASKTGFKRRDACRAPASRASLTPAEAGDVRYLDSGVRPQANFADFADFAPLWQTKREMGR